jgi:hypothetical protein
MTMKKWNSYAIGVLAEIGLTCVLMLIGLVISWIGK